MRNRTSNYYIATTKLMDILVDRDEIDELRARANAGDSAAEVTLAVVLADRRAMAELRARVHERPDDFKAPERLVRLLVAQGDLAEAHRILLTHIQKGDHRAARQLPELLVWLGRHEEARQLLRYGLNTDGSPATPAGEVPMTWEACPLRAISIETTGDDEETARIVAIALVFIGDPEPLDNVNLLIDPGVPIPAEATARHGITTEQVRAEGTAPAKALQTIQHRIASSWSDGHPLIGFDIIHTLTLLDREMRRHLRTGLAVTGPVIDPHIIDLALDRRDGPRLLAETCAYYQVRHVRSHDPVEDALGAARLAWKLARRHPDEVRRKRLPELHRQQIDWAHQHADRSWPLRPNSTVDPRWDPAVLDAIHDKIRTDWETKLRADGPQPFDTELHLVNDTGAAHPLLHLDPLPAGQREPQRRVPHRAHGRARPGEGSRPRRDRLGARFPTAGHFEPGHAAP